MKETAYLFQAGLIGFWWLGLGLSQEFFLVFQFEEISQKAFWAFFAPDLILIALLSLIRSHRKIACLEYIILGAFGYAALYCMNASFLTKSGYLPTLLMTLGLGYNFFLCFHQSLFRNSQSGLALNLAKTLVQIICVWILTLAVFPYFILQAFDAFAWPRDGLLIVVSALVFVLFGSLGLTSSYFMVARGRGTPLPLDQSTELVISGPYHFVRNPMAIAGIGQGLAVSLMFLSWPILVYVLIGAFIWHLVVRPVEEQDLLKRFGEPYREYRKRVRCWIPKF